MNLYKFALLSAAACGVCGLAFGQSTAYTAPVGYVSQTCPVNSDTRVGLPLRLSAAFAGTLGASPDTLTNPGFAILSLSGNPALVVNAYANNYYVNFSSGEWFPVTANTSSTITVDLNGDVIDALSGASLEVLKFWTLGELFNPTLSTNDPLTTGNAIVSSTSTSLLTRRTQVLLPDLTTAGINLASSGSYYITGGVWRKSGDNVVLNYNSQQLWPDNSFIIRQPSTVTSATTYTIPGVVAGNSFEIPLTSQATIKQDNFIAIPRPVNMTLNQLGLKDSGAFLASSSTSLLTRRDELLVYNNSLAAQNKASSAIYYVTGGVWRKSGDNVITDYGDVANTILGGTGFIIRKYQTGTAATQMWNNSPSY